MLSKEGEYALKNKMPLWECRCKEAKKKYQKNNRSKAVCDDVNNFGSSVADKSMDEHRQT